MPQNAFLKLLKSALNGDNANLNLNITKEEWSAVFNLAENHRLLPVIYNSIKANYPFEEANLLPLKKRTKALVLEQILRSNAFLEVYKGLQAKGLSPVIVKGIVCRSLYADSDSRYSTDEDMFVSEKDFCKYTEAFESLSFTQKPQKEDDYQITFCNEIGLHIELHKALFPLNSDYFKCWNKIFEDSLLNTCELTVEKIKIKTLNNTDNLLYLMLHALKHFLHSGVGIRQVCDIIMFANCHGKTIDWDKFFCTLRNLEAEKFALAIFKIGETHLNFSKAAANFPKNINLGLTNELPLLDDILSGGIFGSSSMARQHSAGITYDAVQGKKTSMLKRALPPAKKLSNRYTYAKKCPVLLPVAWTHRLITYKKETKEVPNNQPSVAMQIGKRRLELLSYYGLISN